MKTILLDKRGDIMNTFENVFPEVSFLEEETVFSLNETGKNLAKAGNLPKAEESFTKAIEMDPYYPESYHNRGIIQTAQHKIEEAIESFKKLIDIEPYNPEHYNSIGLVYFQEMSFVESEMNFRKAIEIDQKHPGALFNLGKLLFNMERIDESLSFIERFLAIDSLNTEAMDIRERCNARM